MAAQDFALFALLGFVAQLVDGALGMAYGLIASSALIATGATPAVASASVHAAEVVTTAVKDERRRRSPLRGGRRPSLTASAARQTRCREAMAR